jgi:hypothetical protein
MPRFTAANAKEMAARSIAARKAAEAQRIANLAATPVPVTLPADGDPYVLARLTRVRAQLDRLDDMISREKDPHFIDRLASAQQRLSEQERILAGRPLPGSQRPRTPARQPAGGPVDPVGPIGPAEPLRDWLPTPVGQPA